jgi:hypothetical protein
MLGLLSHSVQAAFLCPLAFGLSLPIAFGQTLLQLTAISPPVCPFPPPATEPSCSPSAFVFF